MSYREMRNFTEMMKSLGYPRLISMENFRSPNFPLTAEILQWLVTRYDQNADIPRNIETEQDRVIYVKMVAHFMMTHAHIRLNTKRIYQADGYAVRELLKVTTLLYKSMTESHLEEESDANSNSIQDILDSSNIRTIKEARQLSSQLVTKGAAISDLLNREVELREVRQISLGGSGQLDAGVVDKAIQKATKALEDECKKQEAALGNIANDEATLDEKIEKKKVELERNEKRLSTLQSVRPAYMDEYEQFDGELNELYKEYMNIFRNLAWLEEQYEDLVRHRLDHSNDKELTLKNARDQLNKAEQSIINQTKGEGDDGFDNLLDDDEDDDNDDDDDDDIQFNEMRGNQLAGMMPQKGGMTPQMGHSNQNKRNVENFGSMGQRQNFSDDDDDEDDDEDDDDDDDDEEDDDDDDDDDDESLNDWDMGGHMQPDQMRSHQTGLRPRAAEYNGHTGSRSKGGRNYPYGDPGAASNGAAGQTGAADSDSDF